MQQGPWGGWQSRGCKHHLTVPVARSARLISTAAGRYGNAKTAVRAKPGKAQISKPGPTKQQTARRKQAGQAQRSAQSYAEKRMQQLQLTPEELDEKLASLKPFIEVVQAARRDASVQATGGTRSRSAKRGAVKDLVDQHSQVFTLALDLELQEEWQESNDRLRTWSRQKLESEGLALFDLNAQLDTTLFNDAVIRLYVPARSLPFHQLSAADIVLLSQGVRAGESPVDSDRAVEGVVVDYSSRWLRVAVPASAAAGIRGPGWRLDLYANTVAYERCAQALARFVNGPHEDMTGVGEGGSSTQDMWRVLTGGLPPGDDAAEVLASAPPNWARGREGGERLRVARRAAVQLAAGQPLSDSAAAPTTDTRAAATVAAPATAAAPAMRDAGLNPSQAAAVVAALGRTVTLWQGPPGTGKTRTLLRFVRAALAGLPAGHPVLATAASNVAVDNIVQGLLDLGVNVVRVGQPAKVSPALRAVTLEAVMARTQRGQQAAGLRKRAAGLSGSDAWALITEALELEEGAAQEVLSSCQVVAATTIAAGDPRLVLQGRTFPVLVLDEATQATEPSSLVPIMSRAESLLLVGDPQQLPPTVKARAAERLGLNVPLFQRLQAQGLTPILLDTQYRMHPDICAFPSAAFYGNRLQSHPTPADRQLPTGFPWPVPQVPVCFVPVRAGGEARTSAVADESAGFSLFNEAEAAQVLQAVQLVVNGGSLAAGVGDVGVITPYNGQVRHLTRQWEKLASTYTPATSAPGNGAQRNGRGDNGARDIQSRNGFGAGGSNPAASLRSLNGRGGGGGGAPGTFAQGRVQGGSKVPGPRNGGDSSADEDEGTGEGWGEGGKAARRLEIKSVDGFQGREKEVIVFSAVRSNPQGAVGFLSDYRRLNVAITRARRGLIVVGDPDTLRRDPIWRAWLNWSEKRGLWMSSPLVPFTPKQVAGPTANVQKAAAPGRKQWPRDAGA